MNYPCTSSPSTNPPFPIRLRVLMYARLEWPASYEVSVRSLAGLGESESGWRWFKPGVYASTRRLPSHGRSPFRSCLRLVSLSYELFIWYHDSHKKIGIKHRGLRSSLRTSAPHKLTPMLGVREAEPPISRSPKSSFLGGGPVAADVVPLEWGQYL